MQILDFGFQIFDFGFLGAFSRTNFGFYMIRITVHADPGRRVILNICLSCLSAVTAASEVHEPGPNRWPISWQFASFRS